MTVIREQDLLAKIEALAARVKILETNNRLATATASHISVVSSAGAVIGEIGDLATPDPDGNPQGGFVLRRADGTLALSVFDPSPAVDGFHQFVAVWDRTQNLVMSDDTTSGVGLARPYLPFGMINVDQSTWPTVTAVGFADKFYALVDKQHPYAEVWAQVNVAASTAAQVQLVQGSTVIAGPIDCDVGFTVVQLRGPVDGTFGEIVDLHVAASRPTGTGTVSLQVVGAWGRQTP